MSANKTVGGEKLAEAFCGARRAPRAPRAPCATFPPRARRKSHGVTQGFDLGRARGGFMAGWRAHEGAAAGERHRTASRGALLQSSPVPPARRRIAEP